MASSTCAVYSGKRLVCFAGSFPRALTSAVVSAALNPISAVTIHQGGKVICSVPHSLAIPEPPPRDFRAPLSDD